MACLKGTRRLAGTARASDVFTVLFCDTTFPETCSSLAKRLSATPDIRVHSCRRADLPKFLPDADVAVPLMVPLRDDLLRVATRLRLIHQWGVGLEGVDIESATRRGIPVCRVPGEISHNAISTAEHAVFLVLSLLKKAPRITHSVRHGILGAPATEALFGKRVLLLGYGHLGKAVAPRLAAFGCHLGAVDLFPAWEPVSNTPLEDTALLHQPEAWRLVGAADVIVLCCMLTADNVGMVNAEFLRRVKPGVRIVNVARGPLLDYAAVTAALDSGVIGGLAMDVFWNEPIDPRDPLLHRLDVVATPHVGGHSDLSQISIGEVLEQNIRRLRAGLPLAHTVNQPGSS